MEMGFRKFFTKCKFIPVREDPAENWDYHVMLDPNAPGAKPLVVALAKPGTGCDDCFFGDISYYNRTMSEVVAKCGGVPFTPIDPVVFAQ